MNPMFITICKIKNTTHKTALSQTGRTKNNKHNKKASTTSEYSGVVKNGFSPIKCTLNNSMKIAKTAQTKTKMLFFKKCLTLSISILFNAKHYNKKTDELSNNISTFNKLLHFV